MAAEGEKDPWDAFVRPKLEQLIELLQPSVHLDSLYSRKLILREEYDKLRSNTKSGKSQEATRDLLVDYLPWKLPKKKNFDAFIEVLELHENQRPIADLIRPPKPEIPAGEQPEAEEKPDSPGEGVEAMEVSAPALEETETGAEEKKEEEEEMLAPPRKEKRAVVYVPTDLEPKFEKLENRLLSMFVSKLGISRENVMIVPESTDETSTSDLSLVVNSRMEVWVILEGIEKQNFEKIKPFFQLTISTTFKVKKRDVEIMAEYEGSVRISVGLPLEVAVEMACVMGEKEEETNFANEIKTCMPEVTGVKIFIGGLPVWEIALPEEPPHRTGIRDEVLSQISKNVDVTNPRKFVDVVAESNLNVHETYAFMETQLLPLLAKLSPEDQQNLKDDLLFYASFRNLLTFAILLLDASADPIAIIQDPEMGLHMTAFHAAAHNSNASILKLLIAAAPDPESVNVVDIQLNTPLHYSARINDTTSADILLKADADPSKRNKYGYTPAHLAAKIDVGDGQIFDLLRESGAQFNVQTRRMRYSPVDIAVRYNNEAAVEALMRHGGNPTLKSRFQLRAIHHAAALGVMRSIVDKILLNGSNPKEVSLLGNALELGLARGQTDIKDFMIDSLLEVVRHHKEQFLADAERAFEAQRELESVNDQLTKELDLLENKCEVLSSESTKLKKQVDELEKKVDEQQKQADSNREEMDKIAKTVQEKQEELAREVEEQSKFTEQLTAEVEQIKQLHEELQKTVDEQSKDLEKLGAEGDDEDEPGRPEASGGGD